MSDPNHEILHQNTLETLRRELAGYNTDIQLFRPETFRELLRPGLLKIKTSVRNSIQTPGNVVKVQDMDDPLVSTPADPHILVVDNASYCTVLFTVDRNAKNVLLHEAITDDSKEHDVAALQKYKIAISSDDQSITLVTGMASDCMYDGEMDNSLNKIQKILGDTTELHYLLSGSSDVQTLGVQHISGLISLPEGYATDRKNHIFLIGYNPGDVSDPLEELKQILEDMLR